MPSAVQALTADQLNSIASQLNHAKDNRGPEILAVNVVLFVVCAVAVVLRVYSRRIAKVKLWWDDWIIIADLFLVLGLVIDNFFLVHFGMGKHAIIAGVEGVRHYLRGLYVYQIIYTVALPTIKVSIVIFYTRIFETPTFKLWAKIIGGFTLLYGFVFLMTDIFVCSPPSYYWNQVVGAEGTCFDYNKWSMSGAIVNILTDAMILALPIPMIWKLRVSTNQKFALCGVFLLGSFVLFASIIRVPFLKKIITADTTWTSTEASIWTMVECCVAIVCACLPILRPLLLHYFGKPFRQWRSRNGSNDNSNSHGSSNYNKWSFSSRSRNSKGASAQFGSVDGPGISGRGNGFPKAQNKEGSWTHLQPNDPTLTNEIESDNKLKESKREYNEDPEMGGVPLHAIKVKNEIEWSER